MRSLRWISAISVLLLSLSLASSVMPGHAMAQEAQPADQKPAEQRLVAAVTHLDKPFCAADTLKQLAARRKVAMPAAIVSDLGHGYRLSQWAEVPDGMNQADAPAAFVLIEKAGQCQLLVSGQQVSVTSLHLPVESAPAPQLIIASYSGGAHCCFAMTSSASARASPPM